MFRTSGLEYKFLLVFLCVFGLTVGFEDNFWDESLPNGLEGNFSEPIRVPGTKWCGPGDDAKDYNDLGSFSNVDICCRAHDYCDHIEKGKSKHGLTNTFSYSKLHCKCDLEFRNCLKKIGTKFANTVGRLYFAWQEKCYKMEYPIVRCHKRSWSFMGNRCMTYEMDLISPMIFQWFDLPYYQDSGVYDAFRGI